MTILRVRDFDAATARRLAAEGMPAALARALAARGIASVAEMQLVLDGLVPPGAMSHVDDAAVLLADAITAHSRLLIVADYDCDGATACAVGLLGLRAMGAHVDYLVPNRFEYGYGLTPEIVDLAARATQGPPDLLITVDNGIASVEGVARANELGISVLVTDHHLPGAVLPAAACIVNPNQAGCGFPSKHLAGVGVMFYVLLALASGVACARGFRRCNTASTRSSARSGRTRHRRRCRQARSQQPHPDRARSAANSSRPAAARDRRAVSVCRKRSANSECPRSWFCNRSAH